MMMNEATQYNSANQHIRTEAIALARSLCNSKDALQRLDSSRAQLQKKMDIAEAKLGTLVQTQIDETRWSLQLLQQCITRVGNVRDNLTSIAEKCSECKNMVPDYEQIRGVAIARRNLLTTIRLLNTFRSIPERARQLEDLILDDDREIFRVFVQVRELVHLRDKAFARGQQYDSDGLHEKFKYHFDSLQAVTSVLETRLFANIKDCFFLAEEDPQTLIFTLKVVEVEDRSHSPKLFSITETHSDTKHDSMMERVKQTLEESLVLRFTEAFEGEQIHKESIVEHDSEYSNNTNNITHQDDKELSKVLSVGTSLLQDLHLVAHRVAPCFPPRFKIFSFYEHRYEKWLYTRLLQSTTDIDALAPALLLDCIRWIEDYRDANQEYKLAAENKSSLLMDYAPVVMAGYIRRVGATLSEWVGKIMQADWRSEPVQDDEGQFSTSAPQDVFCMLNQQLDVAMKRNLDGQPFFDVVNMCADVLKEYQDMLVQALQAQGDAQQDAYLCALLNNCQQMSDNSEALRDRCSEYLDADLRDKLEEVIDDVLSGFVRVGTACVALLVAQICSLLHDKVLQPNLFKNQWLEAKDGEFADQIIVTLQDFFGDFESWISSEFYFARLVKETIRELVAIYIDLFINSGIDISRTPHLFDKLTSDYSLLRDFFLTENITEYVPSKFVEIMLERIEKIESVLDCEVGWIPLYFETIFELYGSDKGAALKSLMQMRRDIPTAQINEMVDRYRGKYSEAVLISQTQNPVERRRDKRNMLSSIWESINIKKRGDDS